jgi:hypothetical protein
MAVALLILLRVAFAYPQIGETFMTGDNDDQMRLVMVRDWLAGQNWFDSQQYRLLPPDGVSMHWSRYVDAGIAAILVPLSYVLPTAQAEALTLVLWPSVLLMLLMTVIGLGVNRLFGLAAAIGAIVAAFIWERLGGGEFAPGRIDHHNVQLLFSTMVAVASVLQVSRMGLLGALAGLAAAIALAVGLEMLPFLLLVWGFAALRMAFGVDGAPRWLAGFSISIGLAAPLLMAGQTPVSEWPVRHCDELAPPILLLIGVGVAVSLLGLAARRWTQQPFALIAILGGLSGIGLWLAAPILVPCLDGPYGAMTPESRAIIIDRVIEAQPSFVLARSQPEIVSLIMTPFVVITLAACLSGWLGWGRMTKVQRLALIQMLVTAVIGFAFSLVQIRALNFAAPALPILAGIVVAYLTQVMSEGRQRLGAIMLLLLIMSFALPDFPLQIKRLVGGAPVPTESTALLEADCTTQGVVGQLAELPPALILSPLNLGAFILSHTSHAATSAGYHRSPDAFWNGVGTFLTENAMRVGVQKSKADYVVICRGDKSVSSSEFAQGLLKNAPPAWLTPVKSDGDLLIYAVNAAALNAVE